MITFPKSSGQALCDNDASHRNPRGNKKSKTSSVSESGWPSLRQALTLGGGLLALGSGLPLAQGRQLLQSPNSGNGTFSPMTMPSPPESMSPPPPPVQTPPSPMVESPPAPVQTSPLPMTQSPPAPVQTSPSPAVESSPEPPPAQGPALGTGGAGGSISAPLNVGQVGFFQIVNGETNTCLTAPGIEAGSAVYMDTCVDTASSASISKQQFTLAVSSTGDSPTNDYDWTYKIVSPNFLCVEFDATTAGSLAHLQTCGSSAQDVSVSGMPAPRPANLLAETTAFDNGPFGHQGYFGPVESTLCATVQDQIVGSPFGLHPCQTDRTSIQQSELTSSQVWSFNPVSFPPQGDAHALALPVEGKFYSYQNYVGSLCLTLGSDFEASLTTCANSNNQLFKAVPASMGRAWNLVSALADAVELRNGPVCLVADSATETIHANSCGTPDTGGENDYQRINLIPMDLGNPSIYTGNFQLRFAETNGCITPQTAGYMNESLVNKPCVVNAVQPWRAIPVQ